MAINMLMMLLFICAAGLVALSGAAAGEEAFHPFFAFKNSMEQKIPDMAEQAAVLAEIGFDGYDHRELDGLDEALQALDARGLELYTIYFRVDIDTPEMPYNPGLAESLPLLKGRNTILWCHTHSRRFQPSDPEGDSYAVPIFQALADKVAPYGVRVAPYPHVNFWVETPEDTARLAAQVDRPNFGASFNLYHWKALEAERKRPLAEVAELVGPRLMVLSINGDKGTTIAIGPLEEQDTGEYYDVLTAFRAVGYRGPVGLQCYAITLEAPVHLRQSMAVWEQIKQLYETGK